MALISFLVVGALVLLMLWFQKRALIPVDQARAFLRQGARVIDVRSPGEYQAEHLAVAVNIPLNELDAQIAQQVPNRDTIVLLHCLSGGRSALAQRKLRRIGYSKSYNLGSYHRAKTIVHGTESQP